MAAQQQFDRPGFADWVRRELRLRSAASQPRACTNHIWATRFIRAPQDGLVSQPAGVSGTICCRRRSGNDPHAIAPRMGHRQLSGNAIDSCCPSDSGLQSPVDTYPGRSLAGHVGCAGNPASGAQFGTPARPTMRPAISSQNRATIGVKIAIDDSRDLTDRLRPGMSVIATIEADSKPQKPLLGAR